MGSSLVNKGGVENTDLIWDLEKFEKGKRVRDFVLGIENKLCIYSSTVQQLYTNYSIFFPREEGKKLVILPSPHAYHDTFHGIRADQVKPTGLFIVPMKGAKQASALAMVLPLRNGSHHRRVVPLGVGLNLVQRRLPAGTPFVPVVMKGDLRELDKNTPCLHLNLLRVSTLTNLSVFEVNDIKKIVEERLRQLVSREIGTDVHRS